MANMPDEILLARMMTILTWSLRELYHDEGYESDNDYGLHPTSQEQTASTPVSAEASFNPADYTTTQCQLSSFTLRCSRGLSFQEWICQHLTFDEIPPLAVAADSEDKEEDLPMAELDNPLWDKEPAPDSREYCCIQEISRLATLPSPPQPYQRPHPHSLTKDFQTYHPSNLTKWKCPQN